MPNGRIVAARKALSSPSGSGRPMSRQELADACNNALGMMYQAQGRRPRWAGLSERTIGALERGEVRWPNDDYRWALCHVLEADERVLGLYIDRPTEPDEGTPVTVTGRNLDELVRRREVLPVAAAVIGLSGLPQVIRALLGEAIASSTAAPPLAALERQTVLAKTLYQACDYESLGAKLPNLLAGLAAAQQETGAEQLIQIHKLAAAAYHVLASLLLKNGEHPLALLAAQRSTDNARASHHSVTIAASARIMAHALASNGHTSHAVAISQSAAQQLQADDHLRTPDAASVYGALVLRAAVAAARLDDRDTASILLDEGERAAARLGHDGNYHWTGFGPSNVLLHRVNVALTLGDAGTAINLARKVDLGQVPITERKASLYLDVAQAYTQWGRHQQALSALQAAYNLAPQEVRTRPTARRVVKDLIAVSSGTERDDAIRFASTARLSS